MKSKKNRNDWMTDAKPRSPSDPAKVRALVDKAAQALAAAGATSEPEDPEGDDLFATLKARSTRKP